MSEERRVTEPARRNSLAGLHGFARISAAAVLAGFALPGAALAQAQAQGRNLDISLRARAEYDSNVARENPAVARTVGVTPGDVRYSLFAAVNGSMPISRYAAFLKGTAGYDFYQKNTNLKRARADLAGGLGGRVGPCQAGLTASYLRALVDSAPLSPTDKRNSTEDVVTEGANTSCPLFGSIGATVSVNHRSLSTSGARSLVDSSTNSVEGTIGYHSRTFGSVSVISSYSKTDYDTPAIPTAFNTSGFDVYSVGLQYARPIGTRLAGTAAVTTYHLHRDTSASSALVGGNQTGVSWNVGFSYQASRQLALNVAYSDTVGATSRAAAAYQKQQRASLGVSYNISRRLHASADVNETFRTYPGSAGAVIGQASKDRRLRYGVSVGYDLGRLITLDLDANRTEVHTDLSTLDYSSDRIAATVGVKF